MDVTCYPSNYVFFCGFCTLFVWLAIPVLHFGMPYFTACYVISGMQRISARHFKFKKRRSPCIDYVKLIVYVHDNVGHFSGWQARFGCISRINSINNITKSI